MNMTRDDALQWWGYGIYCNHMVMGDRTDTEQAAVDRGRNGIRPDADAIAAAEARGAQRVLDVVHRWYDPLAASEYHSMASVVQRDILAVILRECGASEEADGE